MFDHHRLYYSNKGKKVKTFAYSLMSVLISEYIYRQHETTMDYCHCVKVLVKVLY